MTIDQTVLAAILAFTVGGFTITTALQALKGWLKLEGWKVVLLSVVVSYAFTAGTLLMMSAFTWLLLAVYGAIVVLEVNGLYKYIKPLLDFLLQYLVKKEEA